MLNFNQVAPSYSVQTAWHVNEVNELFHDNARTHTTVRTQELISSFDWNVLDHPPYSPDFGQSDFHLFRHLKKHLGGKHFGSDKEVKTAVKTWFSELAAEFFEEDIQNLVVR